MVVVMLGGLGGANVGDVRGCDDGGLVVMVGK